MVEVGKQVVAARGVVRAGGVVQAVVELVQLLCTRKRALRRADGGIAMGAEFKVSDLGVLGYAALTASTLEQSRKLFLKYTTLNERVIATSNEIRDGKWFSEIREMFPLGNLLPFAVEEFVSQTISLASSISNRPFPIREMRLAYPQPANIAAYQRRFDCPLYFDQPRTLVYFDIQHLNDPISLANSEVFKLCEQQCQHHASQLAEGDDLANRGITSVDQLQFATPAATVA